MRWIVHSVLSNAAGVSLSGPAVLGGLRERVLGVRVPEALGASEWCVLHSVRRATILFA